MELEIGKTIAAARRAKNMTQEALADAVGVSIAAVSKWETAASYPDITLLAPIARTLGLSLDELLSFRDKPTPKMLNAESARLSTLFEGQGFAAGQAACEALMREYPSCGALKIIVGALYFRFLGTTLLDTPPEETERAAAHIYAEILTLFRQAEQLTDDPAEALSARMMQVSALMAQKDLDAAEALLNTFPKQAADTESIYPTLYLEQGKLDEAERASQQALFRHVTSAGMALVQLSAIARRSEQPAKALELASLYESLTALFGLPAIAPHQIRLECAFQQHDVPAALDHLEKYVDAVLRSWELSIGDNPLFSKLGLSAPHAPALSRTTVRLTLRAIETEEPFTLLAEEPRYQAVLRRLRDVLNEN